MSAQHKIVTARTQLLLDNPFFGNIAMRLNLIESDQFDTMATDGSSIWFNPAFVDKNTNAHLKGVLAHEVCHVIFKHHLRRGQRDPNNWNTAADYAINSILVDAGFSLPEDGLIDLAYRGQSAEDIYRKLFDDQPEPEGTGESEGDSQGDAEGGDDQPQENSGSGDAPAQSGKGQPVDMQGHGVVIDGTSDDGSGLTASEIKEEEDKWTEIVLNAAARLARKTAPSSSTSRCYASQSLIGGVCFAGSCWMVARLARPTSALVVGPVRWVCRCLAAVSMSAVRLQFCLTCHHQSMTRCSLSSARSCSRSPQSSISPAMWSSSRIRSRSIRSLTPVMRLTALATMVGPTPARLWSMSMSNS